MPTVNGNHSRTGKGAETAITSWCTLCYMKAIFLRFSDFALVTQAGQLVHQHLFDKIAAAHVAGFRQLIKRVDRIGVELQLNALQAANLIAFELIAFVDAQMFIALKRIGFRSTRATLICEQI